MFVADSFRGIINDIVTSQSVQTNQWLQFWTNTVKRPRSGLGYGMALYKSAYFDWLIDWLVSL